MVDFSKRQDGLLRPQNDLSPTGEGRRGSGAYWARR